MHCTPSVPPTAEMLLDHTAPDGPRITHIRGVTLMDALDNLRKWGAYDAYLARLPAEVHTEMASLIATSWVPVELCAQHYEAAEMLSIPDDEVEQAGHRVAGRVADLYLTSALRAAARAPFEAFLGVLSQNHRLWERMYQGGQTRVTRSGNGAALVEDRGNPVAHFPRYRHGYYAYWRGLARRFSPHIRVSEVEAGRPDAFSTRFTWERAAGAGHAPR